MVAKCNTTPNKHYKYKVHMNPHGCTDTPPPHISKPALDYLVLKEKVGEIKAHKRQS